MTVKVPPIKCQGIKTKLVSWIKDHSTYDNKGTWIEPFMGSGVVGFNVVPHRAVFADINPHIINFYNAIKSGKITAGIAKEFLEHEGSLLQKHGETHYYAIRERFNKNFAPLDMLFLNRACFNGVMRFNKKVYLMFLLDINLKDLQKPMLQRLQIKLSMSHKLLVNVIGVL
jgi:DNA adenine methylase